MLAIVATPHDALRDIGTAASDLVAAVPTPVSRTSPRWSETKALRQVPRLGRARAELLDELNRDLQVMTSYASLLLGGVADCLEVAAGRNNEVNLPALSATVRPLVETAGQIIWLLDEGAEASCRVRRYLTWRFADLRAQHYALSTMTRTKVEKDEAEEALQQFEAELRNTVDRCGWHSVASATPGPGHFSAAALLDDEGGREKVPGYSELAGLVVPGQFLYTMLSVPTHGTRWGVMQGLDLDLSVESDASAVGRMGGTGLDPNLAIALSIGAINEVGRLLAAWNGMDNSALQRRVARLAPKVGFPRR